MSNIKQDHYPINCREEIVEAAHEAMPYIRHAATGGGFDYLLVRLPGLADAVLSDHGDGGSPSPYPEEEDKHPLEWKAEVVFLPCNEEGSWEMGSSVFTGTVAECIDFMGQLNHLSYEERMEEAAASGQCYKDFCSF